LNYAIKDGDNWYQMNPPDAREGDEHKHYAKGWLKCDAHLGITCGHERRRLINPNADSEPGTWRIVELGDYVTGAYDCSCDGLNWQSCFISSQTDCDELIKGTNILAIRVRVEQEWPVKEVCKLCDKTHPPNTRCPTCFNGGQYFTPSGRFVNESQPSPKVTTGSGPVPVESNTGQEICKHAVTYYSKEHDNFYCSQCKMGMGNEYYEQHIQQEFSKPTPKEADAKGPQLYSTECNCPRCKYSWKLSVDVSQPPPQPISVKERLTEQDIQISIALNELESVARRLRWVKEQTTPTASDDDGGFSEWLKEFGVPEVKVTELLITNAVRNYIKWHAAKSKEGV
jgi:hypothetical protein